MNFISQPSQNGTHGNSSFPMAISQPAARLGAVHGYSFDGDRVSLNATFELLNHDIAADWSLQLWAAPEPFSGGRLIGTKIAEVPVTSLPAASDMLFEEQAFAHLPAGTESRWMVMALTASQVDGNEIHDYANYPQPQQFALPRFVGGQSLRLENGRVEVVVEAIANPRQAGHLSGTLSVEAWALAVPYDGGDFDGIALAGLEVGSLEGGTQIADVRFAETAPQLPDGEWHLVLMLREWTSAGYRTRDYANFSQARHIPHTPHTLIAASQLSGVAELDALPEVQLKPLEPSRVKAKSVKATAKTVKNKSATATPVKPVQAKKLVNPNQPVSINHASAVELQQVKGLPRAVAQAMVTQRPYAALDDLLRVKGMGPKLLEKLRASLTV